MPKKKNNVLILHNIRSVYNVGAIFRTADAIGISRIYLTGFTPTPLDRFGKKRGDFSKSALGAENSVPWEYRKQATPLLKALKKEGIFVVAVEQSPCAVDYTKVKIKHSNAFLLGNEVQGIPKHVLYMCDVVAEIPMKGKKESLNVSVAAGVVLFRLLDT